MKKPVCKIEFESERSNSGFDDDGNMVDFEYEWNRSEVARQIRLFPNAKKCEISIIERDDEGVIKGDAKIILTKKQVLDLYKKTEGNGYSFFYDSSYKYIGKGVWILDKEKMRQKSLKL